MAFLLGLFVCLFVCLLVCLFVFVCHRRVKFVASKWLNVVSQLFVETSVVKSEDHWFLKLKTYLRCLSWGMSTHMLTTATRCSSNFLRTELLSIVLAKTIWLGAWKSFLSSSVVMTQPDMWKTFEHSITFLFLELQNRPIGQLYWIEHRL